MPKKKNPKKIKKMVIGLCISIITLIVYGLILTSGKVDFIINNILQETRRTVNNTQGINPRKIHNNCKYFMEHLNT